MNIWDVLAKEHGEKIPKLEQELRRKEVEYSNLRNEYMNLKMKFEAYMEHLENTPTDCKVGPWCKACEFGKPIHTYSTFYRDPEILYYCGKAEACQNFVQKKEI